MELRPSLPRPDQLQGPVTSLPFGGGWSGALARRAHVCVCVCVWIGVVGLKKNTQPENCDSTFYSGSYCRLQPGRQPLRSSEGTAPKKKRDRPVYM